MRKALYAGALTAVSALLVLASAAIADSPVDPGSLTRSGRGSRTGP